MAIPLVVLVGFLGSGKTTFLEKVLPVLGRIGKRPHVILNDYRNADVDSARLATMTDLVEPIHGSCVCCESQDELMAALERVDGSGDDAMVLVEANGTTDALELVETLAMDDRAKRFSPPVQVSTVDASRWQRRMWHNRLERGQVVTAAFIWLTRADEVSASRLERVTSELSAGGAGVFSGELDELAERLCAIDAKRGAAHEARETCGCGHDHCGEVHRHHRHDTHHFASAEHALPAVVDRPALERVLMELPDEVIRVKGVCFFEQGGTPHIFQRVEGDRNPTIVPLGVIPTTDPVMVVIGARLPDEEIERLVASLGG